jgi:hypothetical protein
MLALIAAPTEAFIKAPDPLLIFHVQGITQSGATEDPINLLSDDLVIRKPMLREDSRSRTLVAKSVYEAIAEAYTEVRHKLGRATRLYVLRSDPGQSGLLCRFARDRWRLVHNMPPSSLGVADRIWTAYELPSRVVNLLFQLLSQSQKLLAGLRNIEVLSTFLVALLRLLRDTLPTASINDQRIRICQGLAAKLARLTSFRGMSVYRASLRAWEEQRPLSQELTLLTPCVKNSSS